MFHLRCNTTVVTVPSEIQWTSFFFFKMSLMIAFRTEILHMHIIYHRLIYNCMFEHLRLENKSGISCKINNLVVFDLENSSFPPNVFHMGSMWFIQFNDYHVYFRISGCMIKKTVTSRITLGVSTYTLQIL